MAKKIILLLFVFLHLSVAPSIHSKGHKEKYSNHQYGYSVSIPEGLAIRASSPPLPQHGFRIGLSTDAQAYVWVDGGYNTLDWPNVQEAVNTHLEWLKQRSTDFVQVRQESVLLDRLQALRTIVRYRNSVTGKLMIQDLVLALRERKNQTGILYTCGLRTSEPQYPKGKGVFERMMKSWRLRPLPR